MTPRRYAALILLEGFCWLMSGTAVLRFSLWGLVVGVGWACWSVKLRETRRRARLEDEASA